MPTLWEMQLGLAYKAQPGDKWKNRKTGREVEVVGRGKYRTDILLRHQDGRVTTKQEHYFAYDYEPVNA